MIRHFARHALAAAALAASCGATLAATPPAADKGQRIALVIGNSAYRSAPLDNPINDARAMSASLTKLGFTVISLQDASQQQMYDAVRKFGDSLHGGVALFYFAGHGVQVKGHNYLVPVDATIEREDEVPFKAFDVNAVLDKMESARNPLNIIILDACRNNPFARTSRSAATGLAQMDAPSGSIVAFATSPGAEAADGANGNGLYTSYLLQNMATPGLSVEDVFKRTRVSVKQDSQGRQIPWESTSLEGDFSFAGGRSGASAGIGTPTPASDAEVWALISASNTPRAYQAYVEKYPNGPHAAQARALIGGARSVQEPATAPADATPTSAGFSFSAEEEKMDQATPEGRLAAFQRAVAAAPCAPARRKSRVKVLLTESGGEGLAPAFNQLLGRRLHEAGMTVVTGTAAADFLVGGTVASQVERNRHIDLAEISVSAIVSVADASGHDIAAHMSREESYSGSNLQGTYLDVVQSQSSDVAAQVFADVCRR